MARRRRKSKSSKLDSVMTLQFLVTGTGEDKNETIDLSQCASMLNRRFYRQGLEWAVAGFTLFSQTGTSGGVLVSKLPDTWMCDNGYTKAYHAWKDQQDEAIADSNSESAVARYRDFKIHMDATHVAAGFAANLLPVGLTAGVNTGEWEHSQIVLPNFAPDASGSTVDPQEYALHMVGANLIGGVSRGIIDGYADSRSYPQSPDPVSTDIGGPGNWMRMMSDDGNDTSEIVDNAVDTNDDLPYDQVEYPGGTNLLPGLQLHDSANITPTTVGGKTSISGTNFKAGLIRINHFLTDGGQVALLLHLVPGSHRGYLAEDMT
jgi:hypothetical protein